MIILKAAHIRCYKGIEDVIIEDCAAVTVFYGRNNSGKSTILHALNMAGIAFSTKSWVQFQPKLEIKDMFPYTEPFEIELIYGDGSHMTISQRVGGIEPEFNPQTPTDEQQFRSIYIVPDDRTVTAQRRALSPKTVMQNIDAGNFSVPTGLDILYALKHYAYKSERGFQARDYEQIIDGITRFFPEVEKVVSELTEDNFATVIYTEYGHELDLIYAGTGMRHFIDIFVKTVLSRASVVLIDEPEMGLHPSLQRELLTHLLKLNDEKGTQFFIATHSPVFSSEAENVSLFVMQNIKGKRAALSVSRDSLNAFWGDLGIRPSDLLQNDIVVLVEGQQDVIFFEHVLELYREEFRNISVGVVQYGGGAALGIISGKINVGNIVSGSSHHLWIVDRDKPPSKRPAPNSIKFKHALERNGQQCHILEKREIEWYFPKAVHTEAQQGVEKKQAVLEILNGNQCIKFKRLAHKYQCTQVKGKDLRELLKKHLTIDDLGLEIRKIVKKELVPWARKIRGEQEGEHEATP